MNVAWALLTIRIILAGVLAVAAAGKLTDRTGSHRAIEGFGVPGRLAGPLAIAIPAAELAIALLLIPTSTAWWGALGATALLGAFTAAIAVNLLRGRTPDCHCFGQLSSGPISGKTLARNFALLVPALFLVWQGQVDPGPSMMAWVGNLSRAEIVSLSAGLLALALAALGAWMILNLMSQNGRLLVRLEALEQQLATAGVVVPNGLPSNGSHQPGLAPGQLAPEFELQNLNDEWVTLDKLRALKKPVILLFTDPQCGPCNALLPDVASWQRTHDGDATFALISTGSARDNATKAQKLELRHVLLQQGREVAEQYMAFGTPAALLVNQDGSIGSPLAHGAEEIRVLVKQVVGQPSGPRPRIPVRPAPPSANGEASSLSIGKRAPQFSLIDQSGNTVTLETLSGRVAVLLFWNPGCGFCQQMLPDIRSWTNAKKDSDPELVVISSGSTGSNGPMDLDAIVLYDEGFAVGRAFEVAGTPSALLIDEQGTVRSQVAVGAPQVMTLLAGKDRLAGVER